MGTLRGLAMVVLGAALLAGPAGPARAEQAGKVSLKPTLFSGLNKDQFTPALTFSAVYGKRLWGPAGEAAELKGDLEGKLEGAVAANPDLNPMPIALETRLGLAWLIQPPKEMAPPGDMIDQDKAKRFRAYFGASLVGAAETDQARDNQDVSLAAQLSYTNLVHHGWYGLLPHAWVRFELARDLSSEAAARLGAEDETYTRLRADATWIVNLPHYLDSLKDSLPGSQVIVDLRYHREFGRDHAWNDAGRDQAFYGALFLALGEKPWGVKWLGDVFLGLSAGRQPPNLENLTTLMIGKAL